MLRKLPPYLLLTSVTILLFSILLHADTTWVAEEVWGTWTRDGNPYLVTDTLIVPLDSTLNIQPGVQIWFLDQEIRRTPIYVYGRLRAIAEEADSIYFYSPVAGFGGIDNLNTPGSEIRLIYCVIDSTHNRISSASGHTVFMHCRIRSNYGIRFVSESDSVEYCSLDECDVLMLDGGNTVFRYNRCERFEGYGHQTLLMIGNVMVLAYFTSVGTLEIDSCEAEVYSVMWSNVYCHDSHGGTIGASGSNMTAERNVLHGIVFDESSGIAQYNKVTGAGLHSSPNVIFQNNLIVTNSLGLYMTGACGAQISGNTFVCGDKGIHTWGGSGTNQVANNIFVGDGVNSTGIYREPTGTSFEIRYNDFYNVTAPTYNCELDTGNILLDPCFRAGSPYDYQLQANSPCIDAGDPASPLDPDSTRADMGCYFFDHRIDNPPAIVSPVVVNVQRGQMFTYVARATDDHGPLRFGFWNVPGWLHPVYPQIDFEEGSATLSGRVPSQQQDFSLGVWVEDGAAQRDSRQVEILVSTYTIVGGEITGVLTQAHSPYLAVENLIIPDGDSLTIEPGVEIRFQWNPVPDLRHQVTVRGALRAVGTPQDSIYFLPEHADSLEEAWRGIWCLDPTDTTRISYAHLLNPKEGILVDSGGFAVVEHSQILNSQDAVVVRNNGWIGLDSSSVYDATIYFIYILGASADIRDSHFEESDTTEFMMPFNIRLSPNVSIRGCTFVNGTSARFDELSYGEFIGNRVINLHSAVGFSNGGSGIVSNNIFIDGSGAYIGLGDSVLISNNLFFGSFVGVEISESPSEVYVKNNIFVNNHYAVQNRFSSEPFSNISYNDFFGNDSDLVYCQGDSTNIFLEPMVQDTITFRLSLGSPCIDAGDPDPFFNDVDSTRNDIGCWGGPWGESYPYTPVFSHQPKPIPAEFALLPPYPNPFNSVVVVPFTVPVEQEVRIKVFNILGQKVQDWTLPHVSPGVHHIIWDAESCASGIYIVRLMSNGKEFNRKVVLLR